MNTIELVSPFTVKINADNLHDAMKAFVKNYYNLKLNEMIVKDHMRHYKATAQYFKQNGHRRVGMNFVPYTGVVNYGPPLTGPLIQNGILHVRKQPVFRITRDDDKKDFKPLTPKPVPDAKDGEKTDDTKDGETVERKLVVVTPTYAPKLPPVPVAGPLYPFATENVVREVGAVASPVLGVASPGVGVVSPTLGFGSKVLSPVSPVLLFGQRI